MAKRLYKKKPNPQNKGGRPRVQIDWGLLDRLLSIQCTIEECAAVLNVGITTLELTIEETFGKGFREYAAEKRAVGKASLRRAQWQQALGQREVVVREPDGRERVIVQGKDPSNVMLIWLGKNVLGQRDSVELTGKDGQPLIPSSNENRLTAEEELARLLAENNIKLLPAETEKYKSNGQDNGQDNR
jgi:hypothetical protein